VLRAQKFGSPNIFSTGPDRSTYLSKIWGNGYYIRQVPRELYSRCQPAVPVGFFWGGDLVPNLAAHRLAKWAFTLGKRWTKTGCFFHVWALVRFWRANRTVFPTTVSQTMNILTAKLFGIAN